MFLVSRHVYIFTLFLPTLLAKLFGNRPNIILLLVNEADPSTKSKIIDVLASSTMSDVSRRGIVFNSIHKINVESPNTIDATESFDKYLATSLRLTGYHTTAVGQCFATSQQDEENTSIDPYYFDEHFDILSSGEQMIYISMNKTGTFLDLKFPQTLSLDYVRLPPRYPLAPNTHLMDSNTDTYREKSDHYTELTMAQISKQAMVTRPYFIQLRQKVFDLVRPCQCNDDNSEEVWGEEIPNKNNDNKDIMLTQLDQSVSSLVTHLKSTHQWHNTVFAVLSSFHGNNDMSVILGGGYAETSLLARGSTHSRVKSSISLKDLTAGLVEAGDISVGSPNAWDELFLAGGEELTFDHEPSPSRRKLQLFSTPSFQPTNHPTSTDEYEILSHIYNEMEGLNWFEKTNWLTGDPCSGAWSGVTCVIGEISVLDLSQNNLKGTFPSQIGMLSTISSFTLSYNSISSSLPSEIGQLTNLQIAFNIEGNSFSGSLPSEIGKLTGMISGFKINLNSFTGILPSQLGRMSLLTTSFQLNNNILSGTIPSQLGQLSTLLFNFFIYSNQFSGSLPSQMGQLRALFSDFLIYSNSFTGSLPSELGQLSYLTSSFLCHQNNFHGLVPSQLGQLSLLTESFSISQNALSGIIPSEFGKFSLLNTNFQLNTNSFTGIIPSQLGDLTAIISNFYLNLNQLTGIIPTQLGRMSLLTTSFQLNNNILSSTIPSQLGQLSNLNSYFLLYSNQLAHSIPSELGQLSLLLTNFDIYSNSLTNSLPSELGQLSQLTSRLNLYSNTLSGFLPSEIGQLSTMLFELSIYQNQFSGSMPSELGQLSMMTSTFSVYSNSFTGLLPSELGQLSQLINSFFIQSNQLSNIFPSQLGQLSLLQSSFQITDNHFTGSIPSELGQLTMMQQSFLIYSNHFTGLLPTQFGFLSAMTSHFQVTGNSFYGPIPSQLGQLSAMTAYFDLADNFFCGDIPNQVAALSTQVSTGYFVITNYIGTTCCLALAGIDNISYTCEPTPAPSTISPRPSHFPSPIPAPVPTSTPSRIPTNIPTTIPAPFPTLSPSPSPTPAPSTITPRPSHVPSPIPTPIPISTPSSSPTPAPSSTPTAFQVLSQLYQSANGALWNSKDNWLKSVNVCDEWYGVTCSSSVEVTQLSLSTNNLIGTVPSQIGLLTSLRSMSVRSNSLIGSLPSQIGQLTEMVSAFYLYSNQFTQSLPSQLGLLTKMLSYFQIHGNGFNQTLPSQLGQLSLMTNNFYLYSNSFSGMLPSELGQLSLLTNMFYVNSNSFTGSIPSQLGQLVIFQSYFGLNQNSFQGTMPSEIGRLSNFRQNFNLNVNQLTGSLPSELGQLTKMSSYFYLQNNEFCDEIPSEVSLISSLFGSGWDIQTGNSLGTPCCISLPDTFTCSPSASPTVFSFLPSLVPTQVSLTPSSIPTSTPSLTPTPGPTPIPSLIPTSEPSTLPTLSPTSVPSWVPSPLPTVDCESGSYFDGVVCVSCAIGRYSSFDHAPFPSSCNLCPVGQYNTESGLDSCLDCATGKLSSSDRTYCKDCDAGEYNYNNTECVECEYGKYAPQALTDSCLECEAGFQTNALSKATSCSACDAGTFSNGSTSNCTYCDVGAYSSSGSATCVLCAVGFASDTIGSATCTACSAGTFSAVVGSANCTACSHGTYQGSTGQAVCVDCFAGTYSSNSGSTSCTSCDAGKYATATGSLDCDLCSLGTYQGSTGQAACIDCFIGEYSSSEGSSSCTSCDAGKYSTSEGSLSCTLCAEGKYQGSTGQSSCLDCTAGTYAGRSGAVLCDNCELEYSSTAAASSCQLAAEEYYLTYHEDGNATSELCPKNSECYGSNSAPVPDEGFWVDRSSYAYAADIYACPRDTCTGPDIMTEYCWSYQFYNESYLNSKDDDSFECNANSLLCSEGASGPLCGSCDVGYVYRGEIKACSKCGDAQNFAYTILGICGFFIGLVFLIFVSDRYFGLTFGSTHLRSIDSGSLKVCWVTYQIIISVSWNLDIKFPEIFTRMLSILSVLSLEILSLECFQTQSSEDRYFLNVYLWSILPIVLALLILAVGAVRFIGSAFDKNAKRSIVNQHVWLLLLLSYLVLPPVTMKQLQGLDCIPFKHSGSSYLRADTVVNCSSDGYHVFEAIVLLFFCLYQLIPLTWMALLYRQRDKLYIPNSTNEELALNERDADPSLSHIRFLFKDYRGKKWWFEVAEMYRRIMFIGVLPLFTPSSSKRASLGCIFAIISFIYFREEEPFREAFTNNIACIAQITILLTFYTALSIDTGVVIDFGLGHVGIGIFMVLINLLVFVLVIWLSCSRYKRMKREQYWRRPLTTQELGVVNRVMAYDDEREAVSEGLNHDGNHIQLNSMSKKKSVEQMDAITSDMITQYLLKSKDVFMIKRVGAGAFGEVFKGTCMGELVAIKTMIDVTEDNVREFKAEIVLTATLRHPNIVNFVGACWGKELMCLVLEWVAKGSLRDLLETKDLRWEDPLLRLATDVVRGMNYLHNRKYYDEREEETLKCILHRDLKPDNALVSDFIAAKLADFGTSRAKGEEDVTMTAVGTPLYVAPEIARGELYDEKVDVYSFGLTLMEMCVEEPLLDFIGARWVIAFDKKKIPKQPMRLIRPMTEDGWRPVTDENPISFAPPTINSLIVRCCSHDSKFRPSFEEILEELNGKCKEEIDSKPFVRREKYLKSQDEGKELEIDQAYGQQNNLVKWNQWTSNPLPDARESSPVDNFLRDSDAFAKPLGDDGTTI